MLLKTCKGAKLWHSLPDSPKCEDFEAQKVNSVKFVKICQLCDLNFHLC